MPGLPISGGMAGGPQTAQWQQWGGGSTQQASQMMGASSLQGIGSSARGLGYPGNRGGGFAQASPFGAGQASVGQTRGFPGFGGHSQGMGRVGRFQGGDPNGMLQPMGGATSTVPPVVPGQAVPIALNAVDTVPAVPAVSAATADPVDAAVTTGNNPVGLPGTQGPSQGLAGSVDPQVFSDPAVQTTAQEYHAAIDVVFSVKRPTHASVGALMDDLEAIADGSLAVEQADAKINADETAILTSAGATREQIDAALVKLQALRDAITAAGGDRNTLSLFLLSGPGGEHGRGIGPGGAQGQGFSPGGPGFGPRMGMGTEMLRGMGLGMGPGVGGPFNGLPGGY